MLQLNSLRFPLTLWMGVKVEVFFNWGNPIVPYFIDVVSQCFQIARRRYFFNYYLTFTGRECAKEVSFLKVPAFWFFVRDELLFLDQVLLHGVLYCLKGALDLANNNLRVLVKRDSLGLESVCKSKSCDEGFIFCHIVYGLEREAERVRELVLFGVFMRTLAPPTPNPEAIST